MKRQLRVRTTKLLILLALPILLTAIFANRPARAYADTPPFVTLLFSRTETSAAIKCKANNSGAMPLNNVAAYLASKGMAGTGTLETGKISESQPVCTHSNGSLMGSWNDAKALASNYGWKFVSHTATYPAHIDQLSPAQSYAETCGSAQAIDAHGLPGGHGLIAYPGAQGSPVNLQTNYGAHCFAWGRQYGFPGVTNQTAGSTSPFWQDTTAVNGGACNVKTASCYNIASTGSKRYNLPNKFITVINNLQSGQWMTLQAYILVTGKSPAASPIKWDCTSSNVSLHWTNDNERYCYSDYQKIITAITAKSAIRVTDPLTVGVAYGRPSSY